MYLVPLAGPAKSVPLLTICDTTPCPFASSTRSRASCVSSNPLKSHRPVGHRCEWRTERAFVPSPRHGWAPITVVASPTRRAAGRFGRAPSQLPRRVKLDGDRVRLIIILAGQGRTPREIAAEIGVSHETVRCALRQTAAEEALAWVILESRFKLQTRWNDVRRCSVFTRRLPSSPPQLGHIDHERKATTPRPLRAL